MKIFKSHNVLIITLFNQWFVLFYGLGISFVLLMIIPEQNLVIRSASITLIAAISICHYLYKRYSKNLCIQADALIAINTLMQFLIPVFYLAPYFQSNSNLDPWNYRYGYAITSFAALLGQTLFFCGYESIKKSIYFPPIKIREKSYSHLFLVLCPLLILIWIGRYVLLSTGSYYRILRSSYQFTNPFYSVFVQLSGYGLIIVGALFLVAFSKNIKRLKVIKAIIPSVVLIGEILWYGIAGQRQGLAMTVLAPIFAYIFIRRKLPKKIIVVLIMIGLPVFAILGEYRYVTTTFYKASEIDLSATSQAFLAAKTRSDRTKNLLGNLIDRVYDGKSLGYLLMHYSDDYNYELGSTYKNIPFVFIPRFIYTDKPVFSTALGNWYQLLAGGSMPTTFWGESYINFSWFGIILISYLLGLAMKAYDYIFIKRASKPYWVYLYLFSAIYILRLPMQVAVIWMSFLLKAIVLAFIFTCIHRFLINAVRGPIDFASIG